MTPAIKYNKMRPFLHIAVWGAYFSVILLPVLLQGMAWKQAYFIAHFIILVIAAYTNVLFLVKRYFHTEQYRRYLQMLVLVWIIGLAAIYLSGVLFVSGYVPAGSFFKYSLSAMMGFSMEFLLLSAYKVVKEWYLNHQRAKEAAFETIQAELSLLRSQLDAHFIFNTLNNLYLLVLNRSDKAPDAILKLSELLSYKIYDSRQPRVPLSQEIAFIRNYISLQQLRLDDSQPVYFSVEGAEEGYIEPLIIFNFIENAFKHAEGLTEVNGQKYYVYIHLAVNNGSLALLTVNSKGAVSSTGSLIKPGGIGLQNVRKRLNLAYQKQHELYIQETEKEYRVHLTISEL